MRSIGFALLSASILLAGASPAQPSPPGASNSTAGAFEVALPYEKYLLENGLEVILHEDHRTPVIAVNIWYHVGSKDEAPGKNGFAHLFEHVMFQGSRNVGEDQFFKYLERAGASDRNGTTNTDRTNYYETVPTNQLELVLWLESDRMGFLLDHADEKTFASQREVVKNERRQNYENRPYGLVRQFVSAALFPPSHPYHRLTIGTPADLDNASVEDVKNFFRTYYVPNNATIVVAGDIDKTTAKAWVEKYFAGIPRGATPPVKSEPIPVNIQKEKRLRVEADVELPMVTISWVTPPLFAPGDSDLDLLSNILSTGKSSRLYKRLVYDLQTAQNVSAYQASSQLASTYNITVMLKKGERPEQALAIVDEELEKLRTSPPTADELERSRTEILSSKVFGQESITGRAQQFNTYNQHVGDPGYFEKDIARYQTAAVKDVQQAVSTYLKPSARVVTVVVPTKGAPPAGRLASEAGQ